MKLSHLSETLIASEIVKLGGEIREKIRQGETIYNFTVGDFDPSVFPIPKELEDEIVTAYRKHFTNYPAAEGNLDLREAIAHFLKEREQLSYSTSEILVSCGGRPLIYAVFRSICDAGDKIIYAVPSWNNNHYAHFVNGEHVIIDAGPETNFMPSVDSIRKHINGATLLSLCSPQNPTGTTFTKEDLESICDMVLEENKKRGEGDKKLYLMYDQMYRFLTYGNIVHYNPVVLKPEMKKYTIFIDAISKVFAATGVRVGWSVGPSEIINKMKGILGHVGAWAPMAEQKAVSRYLYQKENIDAYLKEFKIKIEERLQAIYTGLKELQKQGFATDAIPPQAAIYLTIKFDLAGKITPEGKKIENQADVTTYLLNEARLAIVPFYAFGTNSNSPWYRLSVGTCKKEETPQMLNQLKNALQKLA